MVLSVAKTKNLGADQGAVTAHLICTFDFSSAKRSFFHYAAHKTNLTTVQGGPASNPCVNSFMKIFLMLFCLFL